MTFVTGFIPVIKPVDVGVDGALTRLEARGVQPHRRARRLKRHLT